MHSSGVRVRQQPKNTTPVTTTHVMMMTGQVTGISQSTDSLLHSHHPHHQRTITHYSLFIICISSQRAYVSWFHLLSRMFVENYSGLLHPNSGSISASHDQQERLDDLSPPQKKRVRTRLRTRSQTRNPSRNRLEDKPWYQAPTFVNRDSTLGE